VGRRPRAVMAGAGRAEGDEDGADQQDHRGGEGGGVDAVDEGLRGGVDDGGALGAGVLGRGLGDGDRALDGVGGVRRKTGQVPGQPRRVAAGDDAAQHGDPQGGTHLARGVVHRGGDPLLLQRQRVDDGGRGRGARQAQAGGEQDEPGGEHRVVHVHLQLGEHDHGHGHQHEPGGADPVGAEAGGHPGGVAGQRDHHHCERQHRGRRLQRRVAGDELEVLLGDEDEAEERQELHGDGHRTGAEAATGEQPRVEHRVATSQLPQDERDAGDGSPDQPAEDGRVGPATVGALDDPEDHSGDGQERERGAHGVERDRSFVAGVRDEEECADHRQSGEDGVEEEERAPLEPLEQQARGEQAHDGARPRQTGPHPDRLPPLGGGERGGERRQGGGHHHGGTEAHPRSEPDQRRRFGREGGSEGEGAEHRQARHQEASTAEAVTEEPGGEEQAGEHDLVGVDDPLELGLVGSGAPGDVGQGHVEPADRRDHHDEGEADDGHDESPSSGAQAGRCVGGDRAIGRGAGGLGGRRHGQASRGPRCALPPDGRCSEWLAP
jgi:hypothetical protein